MKKLATIMGALLLGTAFAVFAEEGQAPKCDKVKGGEKFEKLDANSDGIVDKSEFKGPPEAFQKIDANADEQLTKDEMQEFHKKILEKFDKDGNGELSDAEKDEMRKEMGGKLGPGERFKKEDVNEDGFLDKSEFKGPPEMFDKIDENADGKLSKEELKKKFQQRNNQKDGDGAGKKHKKQKNADSDVPEIVK